MAETVIKNEEYLDMEGLQLYDSLIKAKITTDINANKYDDTALKAKVTANETAITTLNGEGEGSVKKQVNDASDKALADAKAYADSKVKELADGQVGTNKTDIASLKTKIETLESVTYTPITESQINSLFSD